jgi:hypothetical protein
MQDRERKVAAWMGKVECRQWAEAGLGAAGGDGYLKQDCGHADCYPAQLGPPKYGSRLDDMRAVEDEIERRGWMAAYECELILVWGRQTTGFLERPEWFLIRATAAQRLAAAEKVIENMEWNERCRIV